MSKGLKVGISALKRKLDMVCNDIPEDRELIAILQFTPNKYEADYSDVKVKNLYIQRGDRLENLDEKIKGTIYKGLKLKKSREYAAIRYSHKTLTIDEKLTSQVISEERIGEYGSFKILYLKTEWNDYEEI